MGFPIHNRCLACGALVVFFTLIESVHPPENDQIAPAIQRVALPPKPDDSPHQEYDQSARIGATETVGLGTSSDAPPPRRLDPGTYNAHYYPDASAIFVPIYIVPVQHNRRRIS